MTTEVERDAGNLALIGVVMIGLVAAVGILFLPHVKKGREAQLKERVKVVEGVLVDLKGQLEVLDVALVLVMQRKAEEKDPKKVEKWEKAIEEFGLRRKGIRKCIKKDEKILKEVKEELDRCYADVERQLEEKKSQLVEMESE
ncbi:hypothetical protein CMI37_16250 [Candidatus Pacearchaeota archaeon]|jgi:hypothetical protein|nr:hypothetical protein [Candidatus Pacearchaeota archaeon]|tara:strand:+ start:1448 stop:1876 length:429 start_codon:yes stop_codon:yes gene_type:complete